MFTYDKGFLFDYQLSCSQQRGHSGERSIYKNLIVALRDSAESGLELHTPGPGQTGWDDSYCDFFYGTLAKNRWSVCCAGPHKK